MRERTKNNNLERVKGMKRQKDGERRRGISREKEEGENVEERMDLSLLRKLSLSENMLNCKQL